MSTLVSAPARVATATTTACALARPVSGSAVSRPRPGSFPCWRPLRPGWPRWGYGPDPVGSRSPRSRLPWRWRGPPPPRPPLRRRPWPPVPSTRALSAVLWTRPPSPLFLFRFRGGWGLPPPRPHLRRRPWLSAPSARRHWRGLPRPTQLWTHPPFPLFRLRLWGGWGLPPLCRDLRPRPGPPLRLVPAAPTP